MPPRESAPESGGRSRHVHFTYTQTHPGKPWHAFLAGHARWFDCHCKGKTKGCPERITGGEVKCERCSPLDPWEPTGYLPLWREVDWAPVCVIVHENQRENLARFKHRERVLIGREEGKTSGVWVITPPKAGVWLKSTDAVKMAEQDVWPTCLRLWGIPSLTAWAARDNTLLAGGCITPPDKPVVQPITPRVTLQGETVATDHRTVNEEFIKVIKRATMNGKHVTAPNGEEPGEGV